MNEKIVAALMVAMLVLSAAPGLAEEQKEGVESVSTILEMDEQKIVLTPQQIKEIGLFVPEQGMFIAQVQSASDPDVSSTIRITRKNIIDNIYEYFVVLRVGPGPNDRIGAHRVVQEESPWHPVKSEYAAMMVHGDVSNFRASFLASTLSENVPRGNSPAIWLAEEGIDVWGIDHRSSLVTEDCETTGCLFMDGWDTSTRARDAMSVMRFASFIRQLEGNPKVKMFLDCHSSGSQDGYTILNQEAQLPPEKRMVKGFLPGDYELMPAPESSIFYCLDYTDISTCQEVNSREAAATRYAVLKALKDTGVTFSNEGAILKEIADKAANDPSGDSPYPGLTNWQLAMTTVGATYVSMVPPMVPPTSFYHYAAPVFDENGIPNGLRFSDSNHVVEIGQQTPPFQSLGEILDREAISAGIETKYTDHLSEVSVPTFLWSAGGGYGKECLYTLNLLGSGDIRVEILSLSPERPTAFGHADLLWSEVARSLWKEQAEWMKDPFLFPTKFNTP